MIAGGGLRHEQTYDPGVHRSEHLRCGAISVVGTGRLQHAGRAHPNPLHCDCDSATVILLPPRTWWQEESLAERFAPDHPQVEVTLRAFEWWDDLEQALAAATGPAELPDVVQVFDDMLPAMSAQGLLQDEAAQEIIESLGSIHPCSTRCERGLTIHSPSPVQHGFEASSIARIGWRSGACQVCCQTGT